jgi:hypothetical protein
MIKVPKWAARRSHRPINLLLIQKCVALCDTAPVRRDMSRTEDGRLGILSGRLPSCVLALTTAISVQFPRSFRNLRTHGQLPHTRLEILRAFNTQTIPYAPQLSLLCNYLSNSLANCMEQSFL